MRMQPRMKPEACISFAVVCLGGGVAGKDISALGARRRLCPYPGLPILSENDFASRIKLDLHHIALVQSISQLLPYWRFLNLQTSVG